MKKIKISTFCYANNYGAMLQMYALYSILKKKYDVKILNYDNKNISGIYRIIRKPNKKIIRNIYHLIEDFVFLKKNIIRNIKFKKFRENNFIFSKKIIKNSFNNNEETDIYICGSDQVWNPKLTKEFDDIYFSNFEIKSKKIAYAASTGNIKNIGNESNIFLKKIKNFDRISVREEDLKELINNNTNLKAEVCLDPTLLLDDTEWLEKIGKERIINDEYIFAYSVGNSNTNYYNTINYYQDKFKIPVIYFDKKTKIAKIKGEKKSFYTADPFEFLNLLLYSKLVITTSFHGTVFSIIFKKDFIVTLSSDANRITNLCDKLNINNHIITNSSEIENISYSENNWEKVSELLNKEKNKSKKWLFDSINK